MKREDEIKRLLEKFYKGISTLEEECELDAFFADCEDVSDDLIVDKKLFVELHSLMHKSEVKLPSSFEQEVSQLIDRECLKSKVMRFSKIAVSIAACVAIIVSVIRPERYEEDYLDSEMFTQSDNIYIPQSEEDAFAEAGRALILVSNKMSEANENVEYVTYYINEPYF